MYERVDFERAEAAATQLARRAQWGYLPFSEMEKPEPPDSGFDCIRFDVGPKLVCQPEDGEPPCTCLQLDADLYDARGCELCDPSSEWNRAQQTFEAEPERCLVRIQIITAASGTIGEMRDALKAHAAAECAFCASTQETVLADRYFLYVHDAVCCEGKAA